MMKALRSLFRRPMAVLRRFKARSAVAAMVAHESPVISAVGHAISESLGRQFTDEERSRLLAIERRRAALQSSTERIPLMRYGKVSATASDVQRTMSGQVEDSETLAKITTASKSEFWCILLFKLVRKLAPASCVELGTNVGISAAYQATGLELNGKGKLVTLEGAPAKAKIANETLQGLGLQRASVVIGPFQDTFTGVLEAAKPVDYLFNDGHHDHDAVLQYFEVAAPYLADDAVVIIDDISWSPGMRRAWSTLAQDSRISAAIDLDKIGILFLAKGKAPRLQLRVPL